MFRPLAQDKWCSLYSLSQHSRCYILQNDLWHISWDAVTVECTCNPAPLRNTVSPQISGLVRYGVGAPVRTLKKYTENGMWGRGRWTRRHKFFASPPSLMPLSHLTQRFLTFNFSHTRWQVEEGKKSERNVVLNYCYRLKSKRSEGVYKLLSRGVFSSLGMLI